MHIYLITAVFRYPVTLFVMLTHLRLTLLFLLLSLSSYAQVSKAEALLAANIKRVKAFEPAGLMPGRKQLLLPTGFNNGVYSHRAY
jgi:hypothetical protein